MTDIQQVPKAKAKHKAISEGGELYLHNSRGKRSRWTSGISEYVPMRISFQCGRCYDSIPLSVIYFRKKIIRTTLFEG